MYAVSLLDAMLHRPLKEILATLPLSTNVKDALTGRGHCASLSIPEAEAWKHYDEARLWVKEIRTQLE